MASNNGSEAKNSANHPKTMNAKKAPQKSWPDFDIPANQTKKLQTRNYSYVDLKNVLPETVVDVYGVVKFFKLPQKTRGTDYRQVLSIIDPSFCGNNKLTCLLFARDEASLPPVKIGSIVRFHRLRIGLHNGELQGMKASGFSWLVADGNAHGPIIQKTSTSNYSFSDVDKEKIKQLQEWIQEQQDLKNQEQPLCLENIVPGGYFNLVCQVVSVCLVEEDVCLLLQVWDGTCPDYPIRNIETGAKDFMKSNEDLLQKATGYIYDVCLFDDHVKKAVNIQPGTFVKLYNLHAAKFKNENDCEVLLGPECLELVLHRGSSYGRGMKILPDTDPEVCTLRGKLQLISERPQKRQRLDSSPRRHGQVLPQQPSETREPQPGCSTDNAPRVCISPQTKKTSTSADCSSPSKIPRLTVKNRPQITDAPKTSDTSNQNQQTPMTNYCMISTISVIDGHHNCKFSTILDIIECKHPSKFRLLTRVLDYFPRIDAKPNFIKLYCPECHYIVGSNNEKYKKFFTPNGFAKGSQCPECLKNKTVAPYLQYIFKLKLLLTDSLSYMIGNLWKDDAVKFFDGLTPQMVLNDQDAYNHLVDFLTLMCPTKQVLSQRPMMECCIKSYFNPESSICYQLFDTILVR